MRPALPDLVRWFNATLERIGAKNITAFRIRNHDYVSFRLERSKIRSLRSIHLLEDVFAEITRTRSIATASDIAKLSRRVNRGTVFESIALKNELFPDKKRGRNGRPTYFCFVRQSKDRRIHRKRVSREIAASVARPFPRWRLNDPADLEFWVFWADVVLLTLRLSDRTLKYRGRKPPETPGALRPTIAAAMIELAAIEDGHTVLDPMCGTGTLLLECSLRFPQASLLGSDQSAAATGSGTGAAWRKGGDRAVRDRETRLPAGDVRPRAYELALGRPDADPRADLHQGHLEAAQLGCRRRRRCSVDASARPTRTDVAQTRCPLEHDPGARPRCLGFDICDRQRPMTRRIGAIPALARREAPQTAEGHRRGRACPVPVPTPMHRAPCTARREPGDRKGRPYA